NNTTGNYNTAVGGVTLHKNSTGTNNTAIGIVALENNTSGNYNLAIGQSALFNNTSGSNNIGIGVGSALTTGDNNIDIGNLGVAAESNTIRIGTQGIQAATFIAGINGVNASAGAPVYVL